MESKLNAMGGPVKKGLCGSSLLALSSDYSTQLCNQLSTALNSSPSSPPSQRDSGFTDGTSSPISSFSNSGDERTTSDFLGGFPMLPSNDPLFKDFPPFDPSIPFNPENCVNLPTRSIDVHATDEEIQRARKNNEVFSIKLPPITPNIYEPNVNELACPPSEISMPAVPQTQPPPQPTATCEVPKGDTPEIFARKVFIGGLPFDVSQDEVISTFSQFGPMIVDWPYRSTSTDPKGATVNPSRTLRGYVFIVFEEESSVRLLVERCHKDGQDYYILVSSPTMRNKPVQVRPWRIEDITYKVRPDMDLDPRLTVFIGGVPKPTKAGDLARLLESVYGPVCYAGIDIDPELKYPRGAARVTFACTQAFLAAIHGKFVTIKSGNITKRVEVKPYIMEQQMCDECDGARCEYRYAQLFCGDVACLQYYCDVCWPIIHSPQVNPSFCSHQPIQRSGANVKMPPPQPVQIKKVDLTKPWNVYNQLALPKL